ncbi:hypothetical protein MPTK1_1g24570 [Marchantia polymorpha subsp. ruderalis]|uniref:Uncharacterized protein n=2 Tax=Marchantia polymorpha TaxID=3197 RepID=A0AAF6ATV6_MARPO|nr:hypothetical protein MARPO_0061s0065 [Marchantia polymorpha]BBM99876.1 hypothetical protein Mp_1g24570 [Marchantia polymorpha subsp. ruderalis]|eukprot:PTQ36809.1 hypothetical protein MARPO_0061s0065 [Marchantia polymorpha]
MTAPAPSPPASSGLTSTISSARSFDLQDKESRALNHRYNNRSQTATVRSSGRRRGRVGLGWVSPAETGEVSNGGKYRGLGLGLGLGLGGLGAEGRGERVGQGPRRKRRGKGTICSCKLDGGPNKSRRRGWRG